MSLQSIVAVVPLVLSAFICAMAFRYTIPGGRGLLVASALVAAGSALAFWFASDFAGWITAGLFIVLVVAPLSLARAAVRATQQGQLQRAERLQRWATFLHPSPQLRFNLALSRARTGHGPNAEAAALAQIEATGSPTQKAFARFLLASEQADWHRVVVLSHPADTGLGNRMPLHMRALGEVGRLDQLVQTYHDTAAAIFPDTRQHCMLFVFAFTGRVEGAQRLLDGPLASLDDELKRYWSAVAALGQDHTDEAARAVLDTLVKESARERLRRSAAGHLERVTRQDYVPLSLNEENVLTVDALVKGPLDRAMARQERRQRYQRRPTWPRTRAFLILILLGITMGVLEKSCNISLPT